MTTTFETAKVGDRVLSPVKGWGTIQAIVDSEYPIIVYYGYMDIIDYKDYKEFITYSQPSSALRSIPYEALPLNMLILADSMY